MKKSALLTSIVAFGVGTLLLAGCGARNDPLPQESATASVTVQAGATPSAAPSTASVTAIQTTTASTTATAPAPVTSTAPPSVASSAKATAAMAKPSVKPSPTSAARPQSVRGLEIYRVGEAVEFLDGSSGSNKAQAAFTITSIQRSTTCPSNTSIRPVNGQFIIMGISGWNQLSTKTNPQPIWVHAGAWLFYPGGGTKAALPAEDTPTPSPCMRNQQVSEFPAGQIPASKPVRGVVVLDVAPGAGNITYTDLGVEAIEYRVP